MPDDVIVSPSEKLIVDPGVRIYKYNSLNATFEPRLGVKFIATNNLRFKLATGK